MATDSKIFKAYDIRGVYPSQLDEEGAYLIARAFATILKRENPGKNLTVAVGGDMRLSTPALKKRVIQGLLDSGINVDDIGLVSTPTYYFGVAYFGYDGGMQVSASHNPKEYNGMKIVRKGAVPVSGETGIKEMKKIIEENILISLAGKKGVLKENTNVLNKEIEEVFSRVNTAKIKPFKIVIDGSNAMGILDTQALFSKLPCKIVKMNFELDGTFPVHEADPMKPENTEGLCKKVLEEGADLGIAPDGDGDRYFFVDEKGKVLSQAILRGLMAQIELKQHPGATVAYDIRPGKITLDMIREYGGKPVVTPVGHSLIKEIMIKENAIFGGESSGHYYYKLPYGTFDMPMILILKLLEYFSEQEKPFSEIIKPFDRYFHSGEINTKAESREKALEKIDYITNKYKDGKQIFIDGISVEYADVWFNLRVSNTEPVIRLTVESKTKELMEEKRDELLKIIRA